MGEERKGCGRCLSRFVDIAESDSRVWIDDSSVSDKL